jgi:predicted aspartyl protease
MPFITPTLSQEGPVVEIWVSISHPHKELLRSKQKEIPGYVRTKLLIDTGASNTCIDASVLSRLPLISKGQTEMHTPSTEGTPHAANVYDVGLMIPLAEGGAPSHIIPALEVSEVLLGFEGIDGLLGRDVLASAIFNYNGPHGIFLLGF